MAKHNNGTVPAAVAERMESVAVPSGRLTFAELMAGATKPTVKLQLRTADGIDGTGTVGGAVADPTAGALRNMLAKAPAVKVTFPVGAEYVADGSEKPKREASQSAIVSGAVVGAQLRGDYRPAV